MTTTPVLINIIKSTPSSVAVFDSHLRYIAASDLWLAEFNLQNKEFIGRSHYELFPEISDEWKEIHARCLSGETHKRERDPFRRQDGSLQWLSWEVRPWEDGEGKIGGLTMFAQDITPQVEEEEALNRRLRLLNETNEQASIGAWEYDAGSGQVYWTPVVLQIYEIDSPESDGLFNSLAFFEERDPVFLHNLLEVALKEKASFEEEYEIRTDRDNTRWIRLRGNPHVEDGQCVRVSGTIQDIQEFKVQSIRLKDSEEKYKSILQNSLTAHFLVRPDGYILEANRAALEMFGYTLDEMRALGRADVVDMEDPNLQKYLEQRKRTGTARAELIGIRKNGERFFHEASSVVFTDSNGIERTSVSMVDITKRKKAEENLRLSEAEFRAAFEYSALGMALMDIDGGWIRINESFCKILGYTNRELMARSLTELSHPEDLEIDAALNRELIAGKKKSYHTEKRYINKNGSVVWVYQSGAIVYDKEYKPSHLTVQIQDITDRKKTEAALKDERSLLKMIIDNIPMGVFINDLNSRKRLVNRAEIEFIGAKDEQEVLGKNAYELFPGAYAAIALSEDQEVLKSGKALRDREKVVQWSDGSMRNIISSKIPLFENGKISGLLGLSYDMTKFREAERALYESEQKFRKIFENIQDVFYQTDPQGVVTEISPSIEKHSGYTREEVLGRPVTDFYDELADREALLDKIMKDRAVNDFEVRLRTKGGERRYSSVNAQLIIRNGELIGTEGSMRDVTDRRIQEDSLKALNADLNVLNEQKNKLLSVIAHDLRNPISGSAALLEVVFSDQENLTLDEAIDAMKLVQNGIRNAHELLEDLLEWAKVQFDSVDFHPSAISNLNTEITHTIRKLIPAAQAKDIEIKSDVQDVRLFRADKHMIASIIRNLVTNAIKFSNRGGMVKVSAAERGDEVLFSVEDSGVGIAQDDIPKLFGNVTGFTSYGTSGEKGTGMGLGLCRNFVEKHGGRIWAESEPGKGSTFYFTIPIEEADQ